MPTISPPSVDVYLAHGTLGSVGRPGAPILHYKLMVSPTHHRVTGFVEIASSLPAPPLRPVFQVEGSITRMSVPPIEQIVVLEGKPTAPFPLPTIPQNFPQLQAVLALDMTWHGRGSFNYNGNWVEDVPVNPD